MAERLIHLCPGSYRPISSKPTGRGIHDCLDCKRAVVLLSMGRLCVHQRDLDRHTRFVDDGVAYCGWSCDAGVIDGCGHVWPCPPIVRGEVTGYGA